MRSLYIFLFLLATVSNVASQVDDIQSDTLLVKSEMLLLEDLSLIHI